MGSKKEIDIKLGREKMDSSFISFQMFARKKNRPADARQKDLFTSQSRIMQYKKKKIWETSPLQTQEANHA